MHTKPVNGKPRLTPSRGLKKAAAGQRNPVGPKRRRPSSDVRLVWLPRGSFRKCTSRLRRCETWPRNLQHESSIRSALSAAWAARQTLALASYGVQRFSEQHHPTSPHRAGRLTSGAGPSSASPYLSSESDSDHPAGRLGRCHSAFENAGQRNLANKARARPPTTVQEAQQRQLGFFHNPCRASRAQSRQVVARPRLRTLTWHSSSKPMLKQLTILRRRICRWSCKEEYIMQVIAGPEISPIARPPRRNIYGEAP